MWRRSMGGRKSGMEDHHALGVGVDLGVAAAVDLVAQGSQVDSLSLCWTRQCTLSYIADAQAAQPRVDSGCGGLRITGVIPCTLAGKVF